MRETLLNILAFVIIVSAVLLAGGCFAQEPIAYRGFPREINNINSYESGAVFWYSWDEYVNVSLSETPELLIRLSPCNACYDVYIDSDTFYPDTVVYVGVIDNYSTQNYSSVFLYQDTDGDGIYNLYKTSESIIPFPEWEIIKY